MPLREYQCDACGHRFERIQKFSDPLVEICPNCGKSEVRKLLSSPAIQFKGSGFYINDYASKGARGTDSKSDSKDGAKDAAKDAASKDSSSSDSSTKPASSTEKSGTKPTGS